MSSASRGLAFDPASDVFGMTAPLDHTATFPVLGVPLRVRSNAAEAIRHAERSFAVWRHLDPRLVDSTLHATMDVIVHGDGIRESLPRKMVLRRHGPIYAASAGDNVFVTVLADRHAVCFVTPQALADTDWYLHHVNANGRLVTSLVDRPPLHAAALLNGDTAILLTGASGTGKSTLCYACARAGLRVLAEEVVHVSLKGGLRLWGHAEAIGLSLDAPRLFPELNRLEPTVRPDGISKLLVPVDASGVPPLSHHGRIVVCVIERHDGDRAEAAQMSADELRARIGSPTDEGFNMYPGELPRAVDALAERTAVRLRVGRDLARAADVVRGL